MELDLGRQALWRDGTWVHLRPKEARLLELFARSPGRVHSRAQILERVWGPAHAGDPRTVDVHVRWLRAKIERDPHAPTRLLTVRGVGYRLEPPPLTER
jgi:DNA-binding response OmpR family regulator